MQHPHHRRVSSVLTERMALRRFTPADAANLLSLDGDPLDGNEHGDVEYRLLRADWAATHHTAPASPRPGR
jgi:hypothetical protein